MHDISMYVFHPHHTTYQNRDTHGMRPVPNPLTSMHILHSIYMKVVHTHLDHQKVHFSLALRTFEAPLIYIHILPMGRAPCCDKNGLKKGPWTPEEDLKLTNFIQLHGPGNWRTLPKNAGIIILLALLLSVCVCVCFLLDSWDTVHSFLFTRVK